MKISTRLQDIKNSILNYNPSAYIEPIKLKRISRPLLLVATKKSSRKIRIFDESRGLNEIAIIRYSVTKNQVFISEFEVTKDFQRLGIGRFLFEFVMAHSDLLGVTTIYGYADPTDEIKGVSKNGYKAEVKALMEIYHKLGCKFVKKEISNYSENNSWESEDRKFVQSWKSGEIISNVNSAVFDLILNIDEQEKQHIL